MGLLSEGRPLTWKEIVDVLAQLKRDGLNELIEIFHHSKDRQGDDFNWGDEVRHSFFVLDENLFLLLQVELTLLRFDHSKKNVKLLLKAHQFLEELRENNQKITDPFVSPLFFSLRVVVVAVLVASPGIPRPVTSSWKVFLINPTAISPLISTSSKPISD